MHFINNNPLLSHNKQASFIKTHLLITITGILLLMLLWIDDDLISKNTSIFLLVTTIVYSSVIINNLSRYGSTSVTFLYFIVFIIFHLGLVIAFFLNYDSEILDYAKLRWLNEELLIKSNLLVIIGIWGYILGILFSLITLNVRSFSFIGSNSKYNIELTRIFLILFIYGLVSWLWILVQNGGVSIFFSTYADYQDKVVANSQTIGYSYYFISVSFPILMISESSRIKKNIALIFILWSTIAFQMGLRGEVLFPVVATLVILSRNGRKFNLIYMSIFAITILSLSGIVKDSRIEGINNITVNKIAVSPFEAVAEMGGSIRPVAETLKWIEYGDSYIFGASYIAPFERMFLALVPISDRLSADEDDRLMNVLVDQRVGPIGFSPIAEAYYNFGVLGVLFYMMLIGLILGKFERTQNSTLSNSLLILILIPLLIQIRNSFTPVPFQIILGLSILYFSIFSSKIKT